MSLDDRLAICGYGAPDAAFVTACTRERAASSADAVAPPPSSRPPRPAAETICERQAAFTTSSASSSHRLRRRRMESGARLRRQSLVEPPLDRLRSIADTETVDRSLPEVGHALARLRSLRGFSRQECAAKLGTTVEKLAAAESGRLEAELEERLARLYALEASDLREGFVTPVEGVEGATVFLLHGGYQDFDADDLALLDRGLAAGRQLAARIQAESLLVRLRFNPMRPVGPRAADAARQGYSLARRVRNRLGLGDSPLGDLRELLEVRLATVVRVEPLVSEGLRAAAIVDVGRAAAAVLLGEHDPDRGRNPLLARVYLAHEVCHVLFDPSAPGSVRITLDDRLWDRTTGSSALSPNQLMESRAKGFAAEFLLPKAGLTHLLGPPSGVHSRTKATAMVTAAANHFGTPWEIATYHLTNQKFLAEGLVKGLLKGRRSIPSPTAFPTSLPMAGGHLDTQVSADAPPHMAPAQDAARTALGTALAETLRRVERECVNNMPGAAANLLVDWLEGLLVSGRVDLAMQTLVALAGKTLPLEVLAAALAVTQPAHELLGASRSSIVERVEEVSGRRWEPLPTRVAETTPRERFLAAQRPLYASPADDTMERLRTLERNVEDAYGAIDALNSAESSVDDAAMARALAALEDALEREADAAREVLEGRMSALERTSESARRADELIARYEPDAT